MNTIETYLDNMFASFPKTSEIMKVKADLLANMEDKYNELKADGKSENEAIGIVISEFGNIDELIKELGINIPQEPEGEILPELTAHDVNEYIEVNIKSGKLIGIGVVLCILGAASIILVSKLVEDGFIRSIPEDTAIMLGLIPLFVLVAIAVGLFIYSGTLVEKYKYLEYGFNLPAHLKNELNQRNQNYNSTYTLSVIIGVSLCILSPASIFISIFFGEEATVYGVVGLLLMVAIAVYIFIYFGKIKENYKRLLCLEEYSKSYKQKQEEQRFINIVASIVWPIAVVIFLVSGFIFNRWEINWIIFPIVGIIFGAFSAAYGALKEKNN
jgi:MFS family permease